MDYKLLFILFIQLLPFQFFGQDPYYINYDTKDGLPSSEVYAIEVDSNGILWFATDRGVCNYNGYDFKTFTTENGLVSNTALSIWKDRKGNFWFPGLDGALSIYNYKEFYPYKWNDSLKATTPLPRHFTWDHDNNLCFWKARVDIDRIYTIDNHSGKVEEFAYTNLVNKYNLLQMEHTQFIDMDGYYLPLEKGFHRPKVIKTDSTIYYSQKVEKSDHLNNLLFKYNIKTKSTESYEFDSPIIDLKMEKDGSVWVCSQKGLYRLHEGNFNKPPAHYFKDLFISDIEFDSEGNYWLSTLQNGVFKIPSFQYQTIRTPLKTYGSYKVLSIAKLKNHMLFGSFDGLIFAVDSNLILKKIKPENKNRYYWYGSNTNDNAYFRGVQFSERNGQLQFSKIPHAASVELNNGNFFSVGFSDIRIVSSQFKQVYISEENNLKRRITCALEKNDKIWIGTSDGLFSIKNHQYSDINNESHQNALLQVRINDIKKDSFDNIWIGTIGNGIIYKTPDTIFQITKSDGLNSDLVNHVFVDNDSSLWIATNKGLNHLSYIYDQHELIIHKITSFSTTDGLLSNYINSVSKWKNYIWLATNKGIIFFDPKTPEKLISPPKIFLDEIIVNDSSYLVGDTLVLSYNLNDLFFKFSGISYRKQKEKPFYRYRLLSRNIDTTWYYTNNREVRFNDLLADEYTFEAAAQNKYGQWSKKPIIYQFRIAPHFSKTWWFTISCIIGVIGIIGIMVQSRSKRIKFKEQQKRKLQEAELKTKDAQLQALRNQMNPHFVFNALNSIQNFVFKNDSKKANYYLSRFSKLMRDGLQFSRLKYISLEEEIIFLNTYLELEKMRFPDKFEYRVIVDKEISDNQYYIPTLLFQPILENAVKHAFKNIDYQGLLEIHFEEEVPGELLKITITDNGEGFVIESVNKTARSKNKSLGLEIINSQISLLNSEGMDDKASFKIFNRKTLDTQQTGTQAEFIISIKLSKND